MEAGTSKLKTIGTSVIREGSEGETLYPCPYILYPSLTTAGCITWTLGFIAWSSNLQMCTNLQCLGKDVALEDRTIEMHPKEQCVCCHPS